MRHCNNCCTSRISNQGLSRLLKKLSGKDNDPAENTIVRHLAEVNSAAFKTLGWEVPVLLADGRQWIWKLLDPCKTLAAIVEKSPGMQALYAQAWRRTPPTPATPWRVVLGFDEFTPGNKQSLDQTRKTELRPDQKDYGGKLFLLGARPGCLEQRSGVGDFRLHQVGHDQRGFAVAQVS